MLNFQILSGPSAHTSDIRLVLFALRRVNDRATVRIVNSSMARIKYQICGQGFIIGDFHEIFVNQRRLELTCVCKRETPVRLRQVKVPLFIRGLVDLPLQFEKLGCVEWWGSKQGFGPRLGKRREEVAERRFWGRSRAIPPDKFAEQVPRFRR